MIWGLKSRTTEKIIVPYNEEEYYLNIPNRNITEMHKNLK